MPFRTMRAQVLCLTVAALCVAAAPCLAQTPLDAFLTVDNTVESPMGMSWARVVHNSPDAPAVDVCVDGAAAFTDVAYTESTEYAGLPAGTYQVQVEPAGSGCRGPFVIDAELALDAGAFYTVVASDVLESITPVVLLDDNSPPAAGNGHVRFFHGSPDAPAVDVAVTGGPVLYTNVAFEETGDYLPVPAGIYDLEVRLAGTETVVLFLPGIEVPAGAVATAYATGLVADGFADRTLYLADGRFRIEVAWTDFEGNSGPGLVSPFRTGDTGIFYFFDRDNLELSVKVLDGRPINSAFWVFYASLTNVQFELTVSDTASGSLRTYFNDSGRFASNGDTGAFPQ